MYSSNFGDGLSSTSATRRSGVDRQLALLAGRQASPTTPQITGPGGASSIKINKMRLGVGLLTPDLAGVELWGCAMADGKPRHRDRPAPAMGRDRECAHGRSM